ncbi:GNAT family N-acetyltransferase [Celeribacter indicus]|uniref:Putative acetyltransferase n=1 Tax=Celeribacter indicus TaxID=1208324 RepID=A0A0B5DXR5_9RHOB|nr:GNAT family N-acetyltransferase [Celeribacter indicus]AJE48228.1 putative acetyltransferase [Celeribacter indicus]SDW70067.1 Ribosomal protein S18 acetylase RimI [Celeribacter indicus]
MTACFALRPARRRDALPIAEVQVAAWRSAYRDFLSDALIDRMSVSDREKAWARILDGFAESGRGACFVAECEGRVTGFLSVGDQRDEDLRAAFPGEITALYVAPPDQRLGIGSALMAAGARELRAQGHEAAALWVLSENAGARGFYEALGGEKAAERIDNRPEGGMNELAYGWGSLSDLAARA